MENISLTNELARAKDNAERVLLRHYYKYGSVLVGLGLLQEAKRRKLITGVASVRLCDGFAARRLGSATTKRSGVSNEIEPVILV